MRVLAIDTALAACSAAVLDTEHGGLLASESNAMARGHAEALIPLLARLMNGAGLAFHDLDQVVVTTGPGSFTGLRVGISAARAIALATGKPAVGVSTLVAYAAPHLADDVPIPVVVAIDARHAQVYLQVFASDGCTVITPRLTALSDAVRAAAESPVRIVGSAALEVAAGLLATDATPALVDARDAPDIAWVARTGATLAKTQSPPTPYYLCAPDVRPQIAAQLPRR